ncbi:MAG TPA: outer membrane beta-barrel protein [Casimicrobiaceae bacterium]|nr:outer membrane beta-barrel protein [Casimicrobiaceae bacterium]
MTALAGALTALPAYAQEAGTGTARLTGFYGGVALRDSGVDAAGVNFGHLESPWGRFSAPVADDMATRRSLIFGGYRFANDLAIEGSVSTADSHQLWQADAGAGHGVGLSLAPAAPERTWNADVYTSWSFLRSFSLYGRLGYAQTHGLPAYALATLSPVDTQASRDGVNYGVGLRYDVTRALGLRLEYARFPRFAGETVAGPLPDSDQVQFGVQFQF